MLLALAALPAIAQVAEPASEPASGAASGASGLTQDDQSIAQLRAERDALRDRLTDALRQQLQATASPGERSVFLAGLIRDPLAMVRSLGFSLALQELANARPLGSEPGEAAIGALTSSLPDERRLAGELLLALAPNGAPEALVDALSTEQDPAVARVLLRTAARWPTPRALAALERWAAEPGPARDPALDALAETAKRGMTLSPTSRDRVLQTFGSDTQFTPAHRIIQWLWGDEPTRASVRAALGDPSQRAAAVQALSCDPGGTSILLAAARSDATLFQPAASAAATHAATAATFAQVESLPTQTTDDRRAALLAIAANLSNDDLIAIARESTDRVMREALLARLTAVPVRTVTIPRLGVIFLGRDSATIAGLLLLAQTRLELNQPGAALQALDAIGSSVPTTMADQSLTLRTICLAAVDRVEDAVAMDASPSAWVQALEFVTPLPQAPRVLAVIDARYASELPDDLAQRVVTIRRKLGLFVGPTLDR